MNTATTDIEGPRKVGFLLFIGILLVPVVFAWFLLRDGYSIRARAFGFIWLVLAMFLAFSHDEPRKRETPPVLAETTDQLVTVARPSAVHPAPAQSPVPVKPDPATIIANDARELERIEKRLKENATTLKTHYGTPAQLAQAGQDIVRLVMLQVEYAKNRKSREEKAIGQKAGMLLNRVSEQAREIYASSTEESFVKNGFDIKVVARGKNKTQLRFVYALMSKPLVYKFQNETEINKHAIKFGFTKLVYTNGFESNLSQTWSVDLTK